MKPANTNIVCFGEVLWDLLPSGKIAGGAPMNVAYHASQLGIEAKMISKVGNDDLGNQLIEFLNLKGVDTSWVDLDNSFPTGTVKVTLDTKGSPSYEIIAPVAWDYIHVNEKNKKAVQNADAFIFGSLAVRNETSRNTLLELLQLAKLKIFDVNLRSPFYTKDLLIELLHQADIVKMNDEELAIIGDWLGINDIESNAAMQIKNHFNFYQLIVTRGADGAWLFHEDKMIATQAIKIKVQDTIGSGDSFLAGYISKYLQGEIPENCLKFACAIGAFVATKSGGTPEFSKEEISAMTES